MSTASVTMTALGMATAAYGVAPTVDPYPYGPDYPIFTPSPFIAPQAQPRFIVYPDPVPIEGARLLPDGCVAIPEERLRALLNEVADLKAKLAKVQEAAR